MSVKTQQVVGCLTAAGIRHEIALYRSATLTLCLFDCMG